MLSDPVRRRILELLADGERPAGEVGAVVQEEFGISQPAVSQHLRVLRDSGFATVRPQGTRRLYAVAPDALRDVDLWLDRFRRFWTPQARPGRSTGGCSARTAASSPRCTPRRSRSCRPRR